MTRRRALWLLAFVTLGLFVVLLVLDGRMQDAGGNGIVPFEVAFTSDRAAEIIAAWGADGKDAARLSLWLDFLYLIAYGLFLWLAIRALRDAALNRGWTRFARPGGVIAILPLIGAGADAVEDMFLLLVLGGHGGAAAPALAGSFASLKFLCTGIAVLYLLGGLIALGVARLRGGSAADQRA